MHVNSPSDPAGIPRPTLPLARYRMRFRERIPQGACSLASPRVGYLGSAWRGAFGHALRKAVCVTRLPACDPCVLLRSCPYPFLFESRTPPGAEKLTRYPYTPGPCVLEPADRRFDTGDGTLNLGVTLFGSANDHLPYVVHALDQAGRHGLTTRRVVLEMLDVQAELRKHDAGTGGAAGRDDGSQDDHERDDRKRDGHEQNPVEWEDCERDDRARKDHEQNPAEWGGRERDAAERDGRPPNDRERDGWTTIFEPGGRLSPLPPRHPALPPAPPRTLRIRLLTPLRIKRREHFVGVSDFDFRVLMGGLLRRISLLTYFFGETPLETDFAGLLRRAESVPIAAPALRWREWTRRSSRQNAKLQMGGVVGSFELVGAGLDPFWPYLWLGQWTHAGKGCSMGLGRYVIEPLGGEGAASSGEGAGFGPSGVSWPASSRL